MMEGWVEFPSRLAFVVHHELEYADPPVLPAALLVGNDE